MKTISIISHTHWDREWYLNSKYTNEWLVYFFDGLFTMIEQRPQYQFVLDGQTMLLEDYYIELRKKGRNVSEYKAKLKEYVSLGNIKMGPLYNQPDWQLVSEESLVKNLVLGNQISKEYGNRMDVGWLLDNFGQISQTPQILKHAGLRGLYVWRGVEMDPNHVTSEFLWEASDGTKLPSIYLLDSYRNGMRLAEYDSIFKQRMDDTVTRLSPFATTSNLLMLNGYDQEVEPDDVLNIIEKVGSKNEDYRMKQSNPEQYIDDVLSEKPSLQTLKGALYSGRFISVFPGVLSSRMYLKQQNYHSEKLVEKAVEPIALMNWLTGSNYSNRSIDIGYKKLLMNHPHDSICGCSIDDVHSDMEERSQFVDATFYDELEANLGELASKINTNNSWNKEGLMVFNTSAYTRDVFVPNYNILVKDVPAFGYKVVTSIEQVKKGIKVDKVNHKIENEHIIVTVNKNGTIDLFDKDTKTLFTQLGALQDKADSGDEYNYSYPLEDKIITSHEVDASIDYELITDHKVVVKISYILDIPKGLEEGRNKRLADTIKMPVTTYITVDLSSQVSFDTDILNTAKNHIVSALFPSGVDTDYSTAGAPFDVVKRPISYDDYDESEIPQHVKEVIIGAREPKPNTIFPNRDFIDVSNDEVGLSVFNKGLPEFTILEDQNTISLTLFRSVEWVADDINSRLGDAGPKILTPDAQCLRQMKFHYAVYPHKGNHEEGQVVKHADIYNTKDIIIKTTEHDGRLPQSFQFMNFTAEGNAIKVTGFKQSIDQDFVTLRLFNTSNEKKDCKLNSDMDIEAIYKTNFLEEETQEIEKEFSVLPKEIVTLKVKVKRDTVKAKVLPIQMIEDNKTEDYSNFESVEYITEKELEGELIRAQEMMHLVDTPDMGRTALEAQLSAILTRFRKDEKQVYDLGWKLNHARVVRRVWDYIKKYETK